ncbi:hypothetical protein OAL09_06645 [Verrucomicrobia bacterium]|nr:hypothetical protein [Verrucomicrobiota bacterium]|tara:strand:- start:82 stop:534 length:453 start_codon:yes stop_codon:yes gene_type:complete
MDDFNSPQHQQASGLDRYRNNSNNLDQADESIEKIWKDMTPEKWEELTDSERERILDWQNRTRSLFGKIIIFAGIIFIVLIIVFALLGKWFLCLIQFIFLIIFSLLLDKIEDGDKIGGFYSIGGSGGSGGSGGGGCSSCGGGCGGCGGGG